MPTAPTPGLDRLFREVYGRAFVDSFTFTMGPPRPPPTRWQLFRWRVRRSLFVARVWLAEKVLRLPQDCD